MGYYDRYYAPRVNYRRYNLRRPPYGYEWRRYDDRYVLVAVTTGLIMSVILDAAR
jgi:Ni/Co efflux regulator RcnB